MINFKTFDWSVFWRSWIGKNETVASVEASRRQMLRAINREQATQQRKLENVNYQIDKLGKDKQSILSVIDTLTQQKNLLEKK